MDSVCLRFLIVVSLWAAAVVSAPPRDWRFPGLLDATISDIQWGFEKGCFNSTDLVEAYLERIQEVNGRLHPVTEENPDALSIAAALDIERATKGPRGPLHGVPILLKNNIATKDKMNNTAGSHALLGAKVPRDSTIARKLREAGAIILGKANMSQWCGWRSGNGTHGWSSHGGQTIGAYYPNQDPWGSSSGCCVAVSVGLAAAAVGTETQGSILSPAGRNGVVGIKATVGLVSRDMVIPVSEHMDSVGPMAHTVKDAAQVLQAIVGDDPNDRHSSTIMPTIPNYVDACRLRDISHMRIGVPWHLIREAPDAALPHELQSFAKMLAIFEEAGAQIIETNIPMAKELLEAQSIVPFADFPANLASYLSQLTANPNNINTLEELREWTRNNPVEEYPQRDTLLWDASLEVQADECGSDTSCYAAEKAQFEQLVVTGGHFAPLERDNLTAIALPTSIAPYWTAITGAPAITLPMGYFPDDAPVIQSDSGNLVDVAPGIPMGISFLGRKWSEFDLIELAYNLESHTRVRQRRRLMVTPSKELNLPRACRKIGT
ncbi:Amidase [Purpureocillium takamizusanense]|uniref:Amidase n=1 Tax=Purpureocillium takamizusanense TaxID=2060973 RepID=A0A9Q8QU68_9HYPO|nr:Amidase [Purpureocillium takamizusanense]UNI24931.1 Amidase [Purpureocillium takamizusanense]